MVEVGSNPILPAVDLPLLMDIVRHPSEKRSKSTALHAKGTWFFFVFDKNMLTHQCRTFSIEQEKPSENRRVARHSNNIKRLECCKDRAVVPFQNVG